VTAASERLPTASTPGEFDLNGPDPEEDFSDLLRLKERMDPEGEYVGQSLPILRLFRQMHNLNRLPDDPVMILGPTGAGKTRLARLMHKTSARCERPFIDLSADDLVGGDETIRRVRWAGRGRDSGLAGGDPKRGAEGWLQQAKGGTIFVDEFHNLDEISLNYLRKPLDRDREIPLAVGVGEPFKPDVRLIFATYRTIEELLREGKIPPDVHRRLRNRFLSVPPFRERKDDIPLFIEKFRGDCRPGECFYLALLYHDWEQGQVDELITVIRTAVANKGGHGALRSSDLRGLIPDKLVARVTGMREAEVGRELYTYLTRVLEVQGFRRGGRRGNALQKRLAELLDTDEARVSTRIKELGLSPPG
jgi:DNA-binding NtrC family response regulator